MRNPTERIHQALRQPTEPHGLPRAVSLGEIMKATEAHGDLRDGDTWGRWTYAEATQELRIPAYGPTRYYHVDLDHCRTDAGALDWVRHIARKTWATDADVGALVRALLDIRDVESAALAAMHQNIRTERRAS